MESIVAEIEEIVNRETKSWDTQDVDLLMTVFHHDMVVHNIRTIKRIKVSKEGDGAFAVVDIDTLWRDENGIDNHWIGRTCKIYSKVQNEWKMTAQVGVLDYDDVTI